MTKAQQSEQDQARETLRQLLPPGTRVYTILRDVSRSGMQRTVSAVVKGDDGIRDITHLVATAAGFKLKYGWHDAIKVGGCGFDAGFEVVHSLSYALHGKGFECIGQTCPSNDHSNGDRDYTPHMHSEGGYSLRHDWI